MADEDVIVPGSEVTTLTPEQYAERQKVIGGSEVASLFGLGYKTKLELWLEKAGEIEPEGPNNEAIERGVFMEDSIARWAAHRTGYKLQKVKDHLVHPQNSGWGANLDYRVLDDPRGSAPCEIKSVNYFAGKRAWVLARGEEEAPPHIELQLHHQMGAMQAPWGVIAADVGGQLIIVEREWDDHFQERIGEEIDEFWESIRKGEPPEPSLENDLNTLKRLYPEATPDKVYTLDELGQDMRQHLHDLELGKQYEKAGQQLKTAAQTAIWWIIGDAEMVDLGDWEGDGKHKVLSAQTQHRSGHVVEPHSFRSLTMKNAPKDFDKKLERAKNNASKTEN
jgi:putative phage-type endonuclease